MKTKTTLLFCLFAYALFGQNELRHYHSMDYLSEIKKDTIFSDSLSALERNIQNELRFAEEKDHMLPVVFHVLFSNEAERIPPEIIQEQLNVLNADFAGLTQEEFEIDESLGDRREIYSDEEETGLDTRIQFCLADLRANNEEGSSIDYQQTYIREWDEFQLVKSKFGSLIKAPDKYINIWLCNLPKGNSGYAQMPHGPAEFDGIVMDASFLVGNATNKNYDKGHTLTHLMGNYLGLYPLWGEHACSDDYVKDTPIHNAPNFKCENVRFVSTCNGHPTELINNFMDNTYDECLSTFTEGQKNRMQAILSKAGPRANLSIASTDCKDLTIQNNALLRKNEQEIKTDQITLSIFPNPANERIYVHYSNSKDSQKNTYTIEIYSSNGILIERNVQSRACIESVFDVRSWSAGMYLIKIIDSNKIHIEKFIVE